MTVDVSCDSLKNELKITKMIFLFLIVEVLITNPASVKTNTRYVDRDLNRCFLIKDLQKTPSDVETERAQEVNQLLGPKGNDPKVNIF